MKEKIKNVLKVILKYGIIYSMIGAIITFVGLKLVDRYIYSINNSTQEATTNNTVQPSTESKKTNISVPADADSVQYSFDNKYYSYLKDNEIYINNISDGTNVTKISDDTGDICYYNLLYDKNLIMYFTAEKSSTYSTLTNLKLKTYDIASGNKRDDYNTISVYNFSKVKDLEFSPVINIIYINIETSKNDVASDTIYKIDLFKTKSTVASGIISDKMAMTKNKDKLYYENKTGTIYTSGYALSIFKEKVDLIGTDSDDNLYFLSKANKNIVYKVNNNKVTDKIDLSDTDIITTYTNNESVYIVYSSYVLNVSSDDPTKRLGSIESGNTFDAIKDNIMYLRTSDNNIVSQDLSK